MSDGPRHLIQPSDLTAEEVADVLDLSDRLKRRPGRNELAGSTIGMLFFRGSLRTRTSLEVAAKRLGGHTINLTAMSDFWDLEDQEGTVMDGRAPEHIKDAAGVLSSYMDALAIRPARTGTSWDVDRRDAQVAAWARYASVPVINMESALHHPLQGLADLQTMRESMGELSGKRLAIVWSQSPESSSAAVVHSALHNALAAGMNVHVAHPPGFELDAAVVDEARGMAASSGGSLEFGNSMNEAAEGAHAVYARSWFSLEDYGNPTLAASRRSRMTGWKVDESVLDRGEDARFMHAMPVRRNLEVTDAILDGPRSLMLAQAENRLHTTKALLLFLLTRPTG